MNEYDWDWIAQIAAALVVIRTVCFLNLMKKGHVPQRCILGVLGMAVGGVAVVLGPIWGVDFEWPQIMFASGAALFVWLDRRVPSRSATAGPSGVARPPQ